MRKFKNLLKKIELLLRKDIQLEKGCKVGYETKLEGNNRILMNADVTTSKIGFGTYIGQDSIIVNTLIGKYSCVGPRVKIVSGRHPTRDFVSIHPSFFSLRGQAGFVYVNDQKFEEFNKLKSGYCVEIGNDVWIGSDVMILEGVKIGDGAIIGSGTVVQKDVEPYGIYVGNPMKLIRFRFENDEILQLLQLKWWEKGEEWIKKNIDKFSNIKSFLKNEKIS